MKIKAGLALLLAALLLVSGCGKDSGVETKTKLKITGSVTYSGEWSETPSDVRVVAGPNFPVQDFNNLVMSDNIVAEGTAEYTIEVDAGTFEFIGVMAKSADGVWNLSNICGIYSMDASFGAPASVTVDEENSTVSGVDITADRSRGRLNASAQVSGSVSLQGAWPSDYVSALVIASEKDLISEDFDLLDLAMGTAISQGDDATQYNVNIEPGTLKSVGVIFLDANNNLSEEALYFSQNNGGLVIDEWQVNANASLTGPDLSVKMGDVTSGIQGTINFLGEWPDATAEVRLITATTFPPELDELIIGEKIEPDVESHKYTFYLPPDTYKLVGVAWRAEGTNWDVMSICGAYFAGEDSLAPTEVKVPDENTIVKDINMVVKRSEARKATETYIEGSVTFNGAWPADFTEAMVIATTEFQIFPTVLPTMLDLAFSETIPTGTNSYDYSIKAFPGTFAAIGVVFLKETEQLSVEDILYSLDVGGLSLEPFEVEENKVINGPDFNIQF